MTMKVDGRVTGQNPWILSVATYVKYEILQIEPCDTAITGKAMYVPIMSFLIETTLSVIGISTY